MNLAVDISELMAVFFIFFYLRNVPRRGPK